MASSKRELRKFGEHGPPVEVTLKVIGGKWKPLIIYHLMNGTHRSGELHKKMPFVTRRMFTKHLRELETDGIVTREVYKEVPPRVEYSLTEIGKTLKKVLDSIHKWGIEYIEYLNESRSP